MRNGACLEDRVQDGRRTRGQGICGKACWTCIHLVRERQELLLNNWAASLCTQDETFSRRPLKTKINYETFVLLCTLTAQNQNKKIPTIKHQRPSVLRADRSSPMSMDPIHSYCFCPESQHLKHQQTPASLPHQSQSPTLC